MKKTKLEKGITLIALIITIVVLLILAVVTIGAIRDSSIITHSQDASNDHITGQEKEQIQLALGEWQIQKNIPGNTQTFKEVIETELNGSATVGGDENELTVKFKTGNSYKISPDGTIGESAKLEGTALEKYIFGEDLQGRYISEIMDMETWTFNEENVQFVTWGVESEASSLYEFYIKYKNVTYKFKCLYDDYDDTMITEPYYGLTKIEVVGERVGKTVSYDKKIWTILYDDDTNGLQMISNEVYDNFYLGYNDSSITDWDSLKTIADLDGDGSLDDFEKTIYSYNNAITTLNTACENLFKDEDGNYKNSNIVDVRCVGSNPTSKNSENTTPYTSENLAKWPNGYYATYSAGIGNGKGESTDYNYVTDFDRMAALEIVESSIGYWLASRSVEEYGGEVRYTVRAMEGGIRDLYLLLSAREGGMFHSTGDGEYLRPVVTISSSGALTEADTGSTTDYILN